MRFHRWIDFYIRLRDEDTDVESQPVATEFNRHVLVVIISLLMEFNFKFLFPFGIGKSERGRHNVLSRLPLASVAPMSEVVSLFTVFSPHLSAVTLRQFCEIVFAVLAMTGGVTMRNISRWTSKGGSYRTIQRFYNTLIPWGSLCWVFFRTHLWDPKSVYLLVAKSGKQTHGLAIFSIKTSVLISIRIGREEA